MRAARVILIVAVETGTHWHISLVGMLSVVVTPSPRETPSAYSDPGPGLRLSLPKDILGQEALGISTEEGRIGSDLPSTGRRLAVVSI